VICQGGLVSEETAVWLNSALLRLPNGPLFSPIIFMYERNELYREFLLEGLTILKNRGYDSAGIATLGNPEDGLVSCDHKLVGSCIFLLPECVLIIRLSHFSSRTSKIVPI
jgi:hypothetical protein